MTSLLERFVEKYGRLPTEVDPDYLEMLRMSKYRILAAPDVSPGKCVNCGSARQGDRKYVDIGQHVDWFGAIFFCTLCLDDIAGCAGLFEQYTNYIAELEQKLRDAHAVDDKNERLHDLLLKTSEELKEYYGYVYPNRESKPESSTDGSSNLGNEASATQPVPNRSKSKSVKSDDESGSKNVRSLTDLLNSSGDS